MILIFSIQGESTTDSIIEWVDQLKGKFHRVNGPRFLDQKFTYQLSNEKESLCLKENIPVEDIQVIWYRRELVESAELLPISEEKLEKDIRKYLHSELSTVKRSLNHIFKTKKWLSSPATASPNKIDVLKTAMRAGINIPATIVTTSKEELASFQKHYLKIITKPIYEVSIFHYDNDTYWKYTALPTDNTIAEYDENIFPTLAQELIEKEYEVRTFYLDGEFYSMAIFSQLDTQTTVDFRRYNFGKPNRNIPYQLPKETEDKLEKLMRELGMNTGSIDMIKAKDGRYVFLEVNPVGQFGMVSHPCNYFLEKKVAEWMIKYDKN